MEEGFNNANNPFGVTNGSTTDNIIQPRSENLLLNTDKFKQNGTDVSPPEEFFEKSNGKRRASEFDDDDEFGPETDVDTVDDLLSPGLKDEVPKSFADGFPSPNNNPLMEGGVFNPFMEHQEKAALEMEKNMRKRETRDLFDDDEMIGRDETPTPPADAVHDVSGLVDSESDEDEWNYIKGEEANKENISPQPEKEVADIPEEDDTMSQLNPNAAEFVPVSPTRSIPSPACRMLINDPIVSQSPKKANDIDISLPNPKDFEREVKSRPSEVDSCNNGHKEDDDHNTSMDLIENILNGKNIDEIPEFQPGSTPKKVFQNEEFHFGPNAAPFSPKLLDQSEALSTKALFGDESSIATVDTSFNESASQDLNVLNKESDPMSMSIYADKGESNPFDLDKVQQLPDDLDEFLKEPDNDTTFNETISDLPDHCPLEDLKNNDDILKTTDIDKPSYDDEEKELASPLETEKELINSEENLLEEFCHLPQKPQEFITNIISDSSEVSDLLRTGPENIPAEVELLPTVDLQPFENLSDSNVGLSNVSSERILDSNAESSEKLSDSNIEISNISSEQFRDSSIDISHLVPEKLSDPSVEDSTLLDKSDANIEYLPTEPKPVFNLKSTESSNPGFETESETFEGLQDAVSARSEQLHVDFSAFERPESIPSVCDLEESKSPMPEEPMSAGSEDFTRPEFIQQAQDRFEDLCKPLESPQEEITSSVKDDLSEEQAVFDIAKFASQDEIVKDTFVERGDVNDIVLQEAPVLEEKEFVKEEAIPPSEPQEELLPLEISSPKLCICPPKLKEEPEIPFDIKTENISPEFAESAIVTPSEESKTEELIVAQSKNTHSTDNKNVKPLKANVPKVLHDNFEQPRKIRPQVTDYLKNELPICAVLENQDILQDKTTLVPRTFSEKFKCEMPLITSTKSKSKTKISDVCPLSDPISTNLIPKPILDTFKLIMPQTPLASAIAMENKMQKLITPAMGEFNEELRKEHLNDSEMCKSPIDQLKPENIKDQLKCKSLNFIEKELKTLEKGRLMDKVLQGNLSANPDSSSISQETLDKFLVAFRQKLVEILVSALLNFKIALVEEMKNIKGINSDALLSHVIENVQANNTRLGNVIEWILSEDDEPAKEQLSETQEIAAEMTAIGVASTIAAGAALTAVLSDTKPKEEEKHEVKESDAVKKTPLKTTPSKEKNLAVNAKSSAKSPAVSSKALPKTGSATTTPKLSARSSKAPTPKTGPTKTSPAVTKQLTPVATTKHSTPSVALKSTPKTSLSKTPTKPQPIKSTEKITNGETKTSARPPITRKPAVDPMSKMNSKSTTSTSAPPSRSNVSKFGAKPQQITVTKAPVPPRITPPTSARPISSTTRRAPATTKLPTGTTTEKPTSLGATKPLATARAAPKPAPAVPLKLKPSTTAPTKPRVPLSSKPISKVQPDTEKQIKDSANKITASRSVTQKTGATSARTASSVKNVTSTIHKAETKVNSARTMVSKSTTSTTKSAITKKKPTEVLKTTAIKTKTTKIEKPKQNGISTVVTEEITVVNNTIVNQKSELININNVVDNQQPELINIDSQDLGIIDTQQQEPDLIKDNSPIDNKIIETQQLVD